MTTLSETTILNAMCKLPNYKSAKQDRFVVTQMHFSDSDFQYRPNTVLITKLVFGKFNESWQLLGTLPFASNLPDDFSYNTLMEIISDLTSKSIFHRDRQMEDISTYIIGPMDSNPMASGFWKAYYNRMTLVELDYQVKKYGGSLGIFSISKAGIVSLFY